MAETPLHELELRKVYAQTLVELADGNPEIVVVEADLGKASGTIPTFSEAHPERFIDVGVAEANMIGIGAGLAVDGFVPFCASFTPFATRRVYDAITISVAYADANVKIVGTAPGITTGPNGGTHMCFQDLAIMRAMPNMCVFAPCDAYELAACVRWMADWDHPAYMQMIRMGRAPAQGRRRDAGEHRLDDALRHRGGGAARRRGRGRRSLALRLGQAPRRGEPGRIGAEDRLRGDRRESERDRRPGRGGVPRIRA